ncbi:MAG: histidinol-phosphate aminotransferase [Frankiales bacterium]|nr:histidinol-phosphate aminotransferase [Frankiales bacterium]
MDLRHHGDREARPGLVDLAVNVRTAAPSPWLAAALAAGFADLRRYPDPAGATAAIAARHHRDPAEVLVTAGAAEAFVLIARAFTPHRPVAVHPSFTEPEAALTAAGHLVGRAIAAAPGFLLPDVDDEADLVVLGNPTNPTGVLHPRESVRALARTGRTLVVDEAFMDFVPGETESLAGMSDVPGLLVIRSLTKMWGLAGLRIGYVLAEPTVIDRLRDQQPLWAVSTPALHAAVACMPDEALAEATVAARETAAARDHLTGLLRTVPGVSVSPGASANFLLLHTADGVGFRDRLLDRGFAVRRGDTFPGLGPDWTRVAVPSPDVADAFVAAVKSS